MKRNANDLQARLELPSVKLRQIGERNIEALVYSFHLGVGATKLRTYVCREYSVYIHPDIHGCISVYIHSTSISKAANRDTQELAIDCQS